MSERPELDPTRPLEWKPEYSVGDETLDRQHQGLIRLINKLSEETGTTSMVGWVFEELKAYTHEHFTAEEQRLKAAGYPDLAEHKKEHRAFEQWLSAVRQTYAMGASADLMAGSINAFLRNWLINHILSSDMAYRPFVEGGEGNANDE